MCAHEPAPTATLTPPRMTQHDTYPTNSVRPKQLLINRKTETRVLFVADFVYQAYSLLPAEGEIFSHKRIKRPSRPSDPRDLRLGHLRMTTLPLSTASPPP
jgi:hypothetical protein